jgi:hypothetical protein
MDATLLSQSRLQSTENINILRYSMPAVTASGGTSGILNVYIPSNSGKLVGMRMSCGSTKFDVSLFDKTGFIEALVGTLNEFLKSTDNNLQYDDQSIGAYFSNMDLPATNKLYIYVTNNDAVYSTGLILFELVIQSL